MVKQVFSRKHKLVKNYSAVSKTWLRVCGAGKTATRDVSLNVDEIYLKDRFDD